LPRVTIWIRQEDYDKWQAIENKPEWLHEHLNSKLVDTIDGFEALEEVTSKLPYVEPTVTDIEESA
jgi:SPX domain protein involved in polyphosphate accumulation